MPGEMSAYENLAITNFYLGKIEKCQYYNDRVFKGKSEAVFSVTRKIAYAYTSRKFKNVKPKPFKSEIALAVSKTGTMAARQIQTGLLELFSHAL